MCGCDWNFTCTLCAGTRLDARYFLEDDPGELEDEARERERWRDEVPEVGITRAGR